MRFSEAMNGRIEVRVAQDEKRRLTEVARRLGMSLSDFLRTTATEVARKEAA
jgi:antitoxin component of RelBE/YafQ-DinJ toxin-antitoxin module